MVENLLPFSSKRIKMLEMTSGFFAILHAAEKLEKLCTYLELYEVEKHCMLDLELVRELCYYRSVVFEDFDIHGNFRAIFGGGR